MREAMANFLLVVLFFYLEFCTVMIMSWCIGTLFSLPVGGVFLVTLIIFNLVAIILSRKIN